MAASTRSQPTLTIVQLYPKHMNIYGDWGNVLTLKKRAEWRGYDVQIIPYHPGDELPETVDIIVGGGGQDSGQDVVKADLPRIAKQLKQLAQDGTPMLMICGMYQLFGHSFTTASGHVIPGIGLFDATTVAGDDRLIGNILLESPDFGTIIGYENHSGQTTLGAQAQPLGRVTQGSGNDDTSGFEGCRVHNVIGTYLHGSLLPKNPQLADFLLQTAATKRYGSFRDAPVPDPYVAQARASAQARPR